jgi:glutaredoxin 3
MIRDAGFGQERILEYSRDCDCIAAAVTQGGFMANAETKKHPRVIVFSTPTCTYCNMAKKYFRQKGIKFRDVDVSRDATAARDMQKRSGQMGVPVVDIGGRIVVGFDRPKIDKLLGIS